MKLLKKKPFLLGIGLVIAITGLQSPAYADVIKYVDAYFNDIKISVNNQFKSVSAEPFISGGTTYVAVRDITNIFGFDVNWNSSENVVEIIAPNVGNTSSLEREIAMLQNQLKIANDKLLQHENTVSPDEEIKEILREIDLALEDIFYDEYDIEWFFNLTERSNYIDLQVEFDADYYDYEYDKMTVLQMEKLVEKACEHVLTMLKDSVLEDILIKGEVINADNQDILGTFRYDDNEIEYDVEISETILGLFAQDVYYDVIDSDYDEKMPDFHLADGSNSDPYRISTENLYITEKNGNYTFEVLVNLSTNYEKYWNASDVLDDELDEDDWDTDPRDFEDFMFDIADYIADEFDLDIEDDISGYIVSEYNLSDVIVAYEDGKIEFKRVK
ncbi:hypothetical protein AN639_03995 [Candidatus Epulonipiscium fishelsonii]|uniref:Uncharacterized protein n=1 Tax=Candidatus Epulonipiscium fishelsonii TaxID=77094 RepID=A0ACC8X819_9FIRM|nr:hypothetical protein AN396_11785 [Epulopiscium sp. SCG-B11WGA-EpuloA1]ONI41134.1 hypothetical protein AN639_03995 [Epulopiscium sp. SCG-B05WGA-EpuloA1]